LQINSNQGESSLIKPAQAKKLVAFQSQGSIWQNSKWV
jgi:hypothetical protein